MGQSKIEWTDATWNPVTGCTKISEGCKNCYAERMSKRLAGRYGYPADEPFRVTLHPEKLNEPLHWKQPRMVFVCSMGDLFHPDVPDEFIEAVFGVMSLCGQHTFQVLTKRPERAARWFEGRDEGVCQAEVVFRDIPFKTATRRINLMRDTRFINEWPLPNVWLGVTAENQQQADERIPLLLEIPAAVRFASIEPMLGTVQLRGTGCEACYWRGHNPAFADMPCPHCIGLDWVICGGESGPGARPMHPDWARGLRDQCQAAGVPFFFKQWGEWLPISQMPDGFADTLYYPAPSNDPEAARECKVKTGVLQLDGSFPDAEFPIGAMTMFRVGKRAAGRLLDGRTWDEMPEVARG